MQAPLTFGDYPLEVAPVAKFGYLTLTVDMSTPSASPLAIDFDMSHRYVGERQRESRSG